MYIISVRPPPVPIVRPITPLPAHTHTHAPPPRPCPPQGTVKLRISKGPAADGSQDVVTCIDGAIHNAPKLPTLVRCDKRFWGG